MEEDFIYHSVDSEIQSLKSTVKKILNKIEELEKTKKKIENNKNQKFIVTDHAVLRYYERFLNLETENIREEILYDFNSHSAIMNNGTGKLITDKITYIVKENKIVTLY